MSNGVTIRRLWDADLVRETITHPSVWPSASDDCSGRPEQFQPSLDPRVFYLGAYRADGLFLGLFQLEPINAITGNMHICLLPKAYGPLAIEAGREAVQWVWEKTRFRRLVGMVPEFNRLAIRLAERCGFERFGVNPQGWLKHGQAWDVVFLGVSKGGV